MAYGVVNSTSPFLQTTPGRDWIKVGYLNMTDPTQECPNSWQKITSPRSSCRKKSSVPCDSLNITTSGASYQTVCGWFRGYQIGTPDAFANNAGLGYNLETYYVDGVSVTFGSPGNRSHVYTYAVGFKETNDKISCPCAGGRAPPSFVGSDYYCESGNPGPSAIGTDVYSSDVLWDGQQCGGNESTCCNPPDLPWFCKTFPTPISEDLEVRICTDQALNDENVAIESFELYIQVLSGAPGNVAAITIAPTSINVSWNQVPNNFIIIAYEVKYSWPLGNGQLGTTYVNTSGNSNQVILNRLQECVQYNISVRAYTSQGPRPFSGAVLDSSPNVYAQVPQPPEVLTSALTATSANLTWSCPLEKNYTVLSYSVNVTVEDASSINADFPFTSYSFEVLVNTMEGNGALSMPRLFTTLQAPPTSPLNISTRVISYSSVLVSWSPPTCSNGIILGYMVTYTPSRGFPPSPYNISNATTLLLQNLLNNTEYSIFLCAFTDAGCSLNVTRNATTFPGPTQNPTVLYIRVSTSTNVENHQNDAVLSQFQDEVYYAVNSSSYYSQKSNFDVTCSCASSCQSGLYRIECKISIYLNLFQITLPLNIKNSTMASLIPLMDTQNISANGFCSCDLSARSDRGIYDWQEGVPGQNQTLTAQNIVNVSTQLQDMVSQATQLVDQSASNLAVVTTVITQISNVTLSSPDVPVSNNTIINVVSVLSNIQTWPSMVLNTSGSVIVQLFEKIATRFVQQDNFTNLDFTHDRARIVAEKVSLVTLVNSGKSFSTEKSDQISANSSSVPTMSSLSELRASVELPPSLFSSISSNLTVVGIFFTVYKTASLFPIVDSSGGVEVSPLVIGVTVATEEQITNLTDPVVLNFSIPITAQSKVFLDFSCVSWNFKASGGIGNWTADGCETKHEQKNTTIQVQCRCFHLTNFAVLVDISARIGPHNTSSPTPPEIDIISKIGISLSLCGSVTTVITLLCIKKIRQKDVSKYHIQLCCALIGMFLVFVIGIDRTERFGGCVTVSVLIHYFTLASVMWMGAEALFMFQKIVLVFFQATTRYLVVLSIICWVGPLIPVVIPFSIDRNLLVKRIEMNNSTSGYCFINNTVAFFAAFLGPILLVLLFNMIIFIAVMVVLVRHQWRRSKEHKGKFGSLQLMINVTSITFLFGLTWIFGALTVVRANQAFQIVFSLTNSFQGFLIFIFFCVLNSEVRFVWVHKMLGKILAPKSSTTGKHEKRHDQYRSDQSESVISRHKRHMNEIVELKFYDEDTPAQSQIEQTDELEGLAALFVPSVTRHKHNMEDVVWKGFDAKDKGGCDTSKDLCDSNKQVEDEL
eukprot:Em0001g3801a